MKTKAFLFAVLSLAVFFTSCNDEDLSVFPSSNVTSRNLSVSNINELEVSTVFNVYVSFSETEESAVVEANENIHQLVKIEQDGDRLQVALENNSRITGEPTLNLYLKTSKLEDVKVEGAGSVEFENTLTTDRFEVEVSGASSFEGSIAVDELLVDLSGDSHINITGSSEKFNVKADGASEMAGFDFQTNIFNADLEGASSVSLTVNQSLDVKANGASKVYYKGSGVISDQDLKDASEIVKID